MLQLTVAEETASVSLLGTELPAAISTLPLCTDTTVILRG